MNVIYLSRSVRVVVVLKCCKKWAANESDFCISIEKIIVNRALKKFGFKKIPNKGTIARERLALENNSLDTLVALDFHPNNQEVMIK